MNNNDPILNHFSVYLHRTVIFLFLWIVAVVALLYVIAGDHMTLSDWWQLFCEVTSPNCSPATLHSLELVAIISVVPVILIYWITGSWWRGRGIEALRKDRNRDEK